MRELLLLIREALPFITALLVWLKSKRDDDRAKVIELINKRDAAWKSKDPGGIFN